MAFSHTSYSLWLLQGWPRAKSQPARAESLGKLTDLNSAMVVGTSLRREKSPQRRQSTGERERTPLCITSMNQMGSAIHSTRPSELGLDAFLCSLAVRSQLLLRRLCLQGMNALALNPSRFTLEFRLQQPGVGVGYLIAHQQGSVNK